jgi:murein DD-endopeptidase MepM/ murein hydrolase activator NlpD
MRLGIAAFAVLVGGSSVVSGAQTIDFPPPLEVRVPKPPTVAHGAGQAILPYELHVTNLAAQPVTLQRVDVLNADDGSVVQTLADSALARATARPGMRVPAAERTRIGAGLRAIVYLWVPLAPSTKVPHAVRERLTVTGLGTDTVAPRTLETASVPVSSDAVVITSPLHGGPWLAANGPAAESGHRRAVIPVSGGYYIAQRFAIDWVKIDDQNKTFKGDSLKNSSYYAYGSDAMAVADGIVTEVKDGIPQNIPGASSRAVPITLETVGGNHVIVDIGHGHYAFYAHLQPGSIRVRVGDRVKRGEVLGLVGNSGNSTEPHLHFHISDASSPLGAEGIPYEMESFEVVGKCQSLLGGCTRTPTTVRRREMPFANELVRYP